MKFFVNGKILEIKEEHITLVDLIEKFKLDIEVIIVELNQNVIEKEKYSSTEVRENDKVELIQFIGGG